MKVVTKSREIILGDALAYMIDCTLATVDRLACAKNPAKGEFLRQCSIAQRGINWAKGNEVDLSKTRAREVDASVLQYANRIRRGCGYKPISRGTWDDL